ncbi:MAG: chromosomal replication initiator protein DnaA [Anaerolineae bacterium]
MTESTMTAQDAWQATLGQLELQLNRATFETWVKGAELLAYEDGSFVVSVKNAYAKSWLEKRLYSSIRRTLADLFGRTVEVRFVIFDPLEEARDLGPLWEDESEPAALYEDGQPQESNLNPRYTFDAFVVGSSNQLAHAAAMAVADNPGNAYNPLFIYGDVGLGKTHLLHAIGNACRERGLRVLYISSEQFTNELIEAIRLQDTAAFRTRYRTIDVLLVDDIQFIAGKDSTQEEFFHTFNALHSSNSQIVLASDRRPRAMATLEERLRSRFEWGLIADIQPPDLEMRMAILSEKAELQGIELPEDLAEMLANQIRGNIRELEGALNQILAQARLTYEPISEALVRRVVKEFRAPRRTHTVETVLEVTAAYHNLTVDDLTGPRRTKKIALARQQAMYLAREATEASLPQIGQALGGRDHTTVMHGYNKVLEMLESNEEMRHEIKQLRLRLFGDE